MFDEFVILPPNPEWSSNGVNWRGPPQTYFAFEFSI